MTDITIRRLQIFEIPQLLRFRSRNDYKAPADGEGQSESLLYSVLKVLWHGDRMMTLVAEKGSQIKGYVSLIFGKGHKFRGNVYIVSAAVDAAERGQGIGTKLFEAVERYAREKQARRLELEVFDRNTGAIKLYQRLGYQIEGIKRRAVENGRDYDDLVFMAKLLN
jgi:ribosomal protein S18 acetylase RimI-like enzyme